MAAHRTSGESHSSRSTPAVRLPWFPVTRRTADALADHERVRDLCRAFTLRQFPSFVAFAILICIARTFRSTRRQSMVVQLRGAPESAESSLQMIASMLLSYREVSPTPGDNMPPRGTLAPEGKNLVEMGSVKPSCDERPVGSLPAFAWDDVSIPIRAITARRSLPPTSLTRITHSVPCGSPAEVNSPSAVIRAYCVPCTLHDWVRVCLSAGGPVATCPELQARQLTTYLFGRCPTAFGTTMLTTFISSSHVLPIPASLAPRSRCCSGPLPHLLTKERHPRGGYIVRKASHPTVTGDACLPRLLLVA